MRRTLILLMLSLLGSVGAQTDPTTLPLIQQADLIYNGGFRTPSSLAGAGGAGLVYDPVRQSLVVVGPGYRDLIEISIPSPSTGALLTWPIAGQMTSSFDPSEGTVSQFGTGEFRTGGLLLVAPRVLISGYIYYDSSGTQAKATHYARPSDLASRGQVLSPLRVGLLNPGHYGGPMTLVPQEWQAVVGGSALTGLCCVPIVSRTSNGPAFHVFNPSDLGSVAAPIPAKAMLDYPLSQPLGPYTGPPHAYHNGTTEIGGVLWVPGTRSILTFGMHGTGPSCYGDGTAQNPPPFGACYDPEMVGTKGMHAYPYEARVTAYDAKDLLPVLQGTTPTYVPRPYATWALPFQHHGYKKRTYGVGFDPATGRIWLAALYGDGTKPTIHELRVKSAPPPPPPPPPVDCVVSAWSVWAPVDATTEQRTRTVTVAPSGGGLACPVLVETRLIPPPPPPPVTLTATMTTKTCTLVVTDTPPDALGGWRVQFTRNPEVSHGTVDATFPYTRSASVTAGSYTIGAMWTRDGSLTVTRSMLTKVCP